MRCPHPRGGYKNRNAYAKVHLQSKKKLEIRHSVNQKVTYLLGQFGAAGFVTCLELTESHFNIFASLPIWLLLLVNTQLASLSVAGVDSASEIVLRSMCTRRRIRLYGNNLIGILLARRYRILVGYLWIAGREHIAETAASYGDTHNTTAAGNASRGADRATTAAVIIVSCAKRPIRWRFAGNHHRGSTHAFWIEDGWNFAVARHSLIAKRRRRSYCKDKPNKSYSRACPVLKTVQRHKIICHILLSNSHTHVQSVLCSGLEN